MSLAPGTRLGGYDILGALGAGGMGEVYRARDSRLQRDVAIKVLPDLFSSDPDRVARFEREAQTLASLNHPNVAQIYGVVDRPVALVMELVEGEDLAHRLTRGALSIDDTLPIARQMAEALEAAHERGIVHRDFKPANVKVTADGTVKVLDFGLAKAIDLASDVPGSGHAANSPTFTAHATALGMIVGTAAYMAPEQARGKTADRRADIWAFGVVVYEMLCGRQAFAGESITDVLASVLRQDIDWSALPPATPPRLRRLLDRCLERDPKLRLRDIGEARVELARIEAGAPDLSSSPAIVPAAAAVGRRRPIGRVFWPALAAVMTLVAVASVWRGLQPARSPAPLTRLSLLPPPGSALYPDSNAIAISPDGTMVAFVVGQPASPDTQLWVRSLDATAARHIENTDGASLPFWSPDSRRIGFFGRAKLQSVAAGGGRVDVICDAPAQRGAAWTPSNVILFARDSSGPIYRVPAGGGTPVAVTTLDASRKESSHRFPALLPDGDRFLYAALPAHDGRFEIYADSLSHPGRRLIGSMESAPAYADPGWLLYLRRGLLIAQHFDSRTLALDGDPITLDDEPSVIRDPQTAYTAGRPAGASSNGSLAYYSAPSNRTRAQWYDLSGKPGEIVDLPVAHYDQVAVSPDGTRAVLVRSVSASDSALWLADLRNGGASPLAAVPGRNDQPVWSPDSRRVAFEANGSGVADLFVKTIGDASPPAPLYRSDALFKNPSAWSPDGRWIAVTQIDPGKAQDIWVLPASGGTLQPYVSGPRRDIPVSISPDSRWLAYLSDESERFQLYVQSFPEPGHMVQVSSASVGAYGGWWSADGRQLLFASADRTTLWRADFHDGATPAVGTPQLLTRLSPDLISIDFSPDRSRFLALAPDRTGTGSITIVQNWRAALDARR